MTLNFFHFVVLQLEKRSTEDNDGYGDDTCARASTRALYRNLFDTIDRR